ncbi:DUF1120 domain-containing protein [Enterobacter cloacae]|uniref:hypothetical protein n=1 Tax=Enterobacter cloacae TaxID=550 RepID=UPI000BA15BAF|nr:hypothetical protein [Enterobacter cloacae]OZU91386.1 hypothetical protein CIW67_19565 [Enterobacter cloacae]PAN81110.1 hypothetical protein CIW66_19905 [Enterobacter cloacae]PAN94224.1 hypothetical protein CIW63_19795 [Enterobacter cloacae]HAS1027790.1 hypothetical protein [Enterobacter cloacae]HAS1036731.1 hypothetical protein [Enterobacter cloacae]
MLKCTIASALLVVCMAISHVPSALAEEGCQVASSVKNIEYGRLRRESLREARTDIEGKSYKGYASIERDIQVTVICPDERKIRLSVDGPARGSKAFRFSDNGAMRIIAKEARVDSGVVQVAVVPRGSELLTAGASETALPPGMSLAALNGQEVTGKQLVVTLSVVTYLNDNAFKVSNTSEIEELLTVNYETLTAH